MEGFVVTQSDVVYCSECQEDLAHDSPASVEYEIFSRIPYGVCNFCGISVQEPKAYASGTNIL